MKARVKNKLYDVKHTTGEVEVDGDRFLVEILELTDEKAILSVNNAIHECRYELLAKGVNMYDATLGEFFVEFPSDGQVLAEEYAAEQRLAAQSGDVFAQMPGLITSIKVKEGDEIKEGQELFVLEAMKMENTIQCEYDGVIEKVAVKEGQTVNKGDLLIKVQS